MSWEDMYHLIWWVGIMGMNSHEKIMGNDDVWGYYISMVINDG
jgi:hypothetical protein